MASSAARGFNAFLGRLPGHARGEEPEGERHLKAQLEERDRQLRQARTQLRRTRRRLEEARKQKKVPRPAADGVKPGKSLWHRQVVGGWWEEIGKLQFDFLCERGLRPRHLFLDVGCGSLRGGVRFIPYLEATHYYGIDKDRRLLDAGREELREANLLDRKPTLEHMEDFGFERLGRMFDYALAQSVFTHLPLNLICRCLVNVDAVLLPGGVFFATFFENHGGKRHLEPLEQAGAITTYYDRDPFHYTLDAFEWACEGTSLRVEYIGGWNHPRNQLMLAFHKTA